MRQARSTSISPLSGPNVTPGQFGVGLVQGVMPIPRNQHTPQRWLIESIQLGGGIVDDLLPIECRDLAQMLGDIILGMRERGLPVRVV